MRRNHIVTLCALTIVLVGCSRGISEEFRGDVTNFLDQGERLSVMTSQGVSFTEYRTQLVEVKSAYARLDGRWPSALSDYESRFEKAIDGWDLALRTWKYHIDRDSTFRDTAMGAGEDLNPAIARYLEADEEDVRWAKTDRLISILLTKASSTFDLARDSLVDELE